MTQILRVAILGAESTGKSTLAPALAARFGTVWVPEYLREFVEQHKRTPREDEQFFIATTQVAREEQAAPAACRFLICDTTPLMTAIYSRFYWGSAGEALDLLASRRAYDFTLVTAPDTPWVADGLQRESAEVRQTIHRMLLETLAQSATPFSLITGELPQRLMQAATCLNQADTELAQKSNCADTR